MHRRYGLLLAIPLLCFASSARAQTEPECNVTAVPGPNGFNVKDIEWDAKGDGINDDTHAIRCAIQRAEVWSTRISGSVAVGAQVYFPAGRYRVKGTLAVRQHYVSLTGQGPHTSMIVRAADFAPGADTILIAHTTAGAQLHGNNISGLALDAEGNESSGAHLHLVDVDRADYTDLHLSEGFGGIHLEGGQTLAFTNVNVFTDAHFPAGQLKAGSFLVKLAPGLSADVRNPTDVHFTGGNWRSTSGRARVEYGLRIHASDAVYFSNIHVLGGGVADVLIQPVAATSHLSGLRFSNCWFDPPHSAEDVPISPAALWVTGETANSTVPFGLITFDECMFWGGGGGGTNSAKIERGVLVNSSSLKGLIISDSTIHGFRSHGIHLASSSNVLLSGNQISNNRDWSSGFGAGVMIEAGVSDFQILNNVIGPNLATFTSRHTYGIYLPTGASNRYSIVGNVVLNCLSGYPAIQETGAGPIKLVSSNLAPTCQ